MESAGGQKQTGAHARVQRFARWAPLVGTGLWLLWAVSLVYALRFVDVAHSGWPRVCGWVLWLAWLASGLFITAHDACHGSAWPRSPRGNRWLGRLCAFCYASFSFAWLRSQHRLHHAHPNTPADPDGCGQAVAEAAWWRWAWRFGTHYVTPTQLLGQAAVFTALRHVAHVPAANALCLWALPPLLSAMAMFCFGTYLPHRPKRSAPFADRHRARSQHWPLLASLCSCHFFGIHHEHHLFPHVPWYCLPLVRRPTNAASANASDRRR